MTDDEAAAATALRSGALRDFGPPIAADAALSTGPGAGDELEGGGDDADDVEGVVDGDGRGRFQMRVPMTDTPVPGLLRYALELIGLTAGGPGEKVAWWIEATFNGRPCTVTHEKFGVRLYLSGCDGQASAEREMRTMLKKLTSAAKVAEKVLRQQVSDSLENGAATVANQWHSLDSAYRYFRDRALNPAHVEDVITRHETTYGHSTSYTIGALVMATNARHDMVAAITAYLSTLEHLLVLALPFAGYDPSTDSLPGIIGARWGLKWDRIIDPGSRDGARLRGRLTDVIETWRNPYTHGGFEKLGHGATVHVHTPVGALPMGMTGAYSSRGPSILPMPSTTVEEVFALLDELDEWLEQTMPHAIAWAKAGLDVQFDKKFRDQLTAARVNDEQFAQFLDYYSELIDRYANMDF